MNGQLKTVAPVALLTGAAANIYTPAASTIYTVLFHMHFANVTSGAITVTIYIGATGASAAGTEIMKGKSIPANDVYDFYWPKGRKMLSTDFLTGLASAINSITIEVIGEQFVV